MKYSLCDDWFFTESWSQAFAQGADVPAAAVRLPHTCRELPLHNAAPEQYEMVCGYRRRLRVPDAKTAPRLFLRFDGAAHQAEVYLNGKKVGSHRGGYTGFELEITDYADREKENLLAVRLDTREAWLITSGQSRVKDLFVYTPDLSHAQVELALDRPEGAAAVRLSLRAPEGKRLADKQIGPGETKACLEYLQAKPWTPEVPNLYLLTAELLDEAGRLTESRTVRFGFRTAQFRADGFYLNWMKCFLRGLNRHQSYPYIGYAATERLQWEDARILRRSWAALPSAPATTRRASIFWMPATSWGCWCLRSCPAGSISATRPGSSRPATHCGR